MISKSSSETKQIAKDLSERVKNGGVILLYGDLGSGKTTFVKGIAEGLNLKEFNIKSPTYTYIRHLKLKNSNFYHIDLYRIEAIDELLMQEIKEITQNPKNITLIEWAERLHLDLNQKPIKIILKYIDEEKRSIEIKEETKAITSMEITKIYQEFFVPNHIIKHMKQVAVIAELLCNLAKKKNLSIDKKSIINAALLHDVLRFVDIKNFLPEKFSPAADKEAKNLWKSLRKKYGKVGHEKAMGDYLSNNGYSHLGNLVAKHGFFEIYNLSSLDEKILYYADKRVDNDKIVDLKTRLSEGKKRNITSSDNQALIKKTEKEVFNLEKQLSKLLGQNIDQL